MPANRLAPVVIALVLGAAACSGAPKVSTSTSTSSPAPPPAAAASPGAFRRGALAGTVSTFDGTTLVLATRQGGTVDVQTSGSTAVTRSVTGTASDLVPDVTVVVSHPPLARVDGEAAEDELLVVRRLLAGRLLRLAHVRADAGEQLAGPERLVDVVIGADLQAEDDVDLLVLRAQDHHGHLVSGPPDLPADVES